MKRLLHVVDPCAERWESMPGSAARRFCERCGKHVHSLSDMTELEAEQLVASAPRGICVRVEHDEGGRVRFNVGRDSAFAGPFRNAGPGLAGRALPGLRVAAVASLLVAGACGGETPKAPAEVGPAPEAASPATDAGATPAAATQTGAEPGAAAATDCAGGIDAGADAGPGAKQGTRVTMGCLCAPGDVLCDCL